jgi:hypothetical protein
MNSGKLLDSVISLNGALLPLPGLWGQVFAPAATNCFDLVPGLRPAFTWRSRQCMLIRSIAYWQVPDRT